ncbi:hypothetical protein Ndes2437B_g07247 [Nannochloris sp. 'desiccata']
MITLSRHLWHPISKSFFIVKIRNNHCRWTATSGSLDGPDDANYSESSYPPPPPPSTPVTQEPKEDIAKLIYHAGRFVLDPIPYIVQLARFCTSSVALTKQFYKPRLSSIISRSIRVLLVVFVFCAVICLVDAGCSLLTNYFSLAAH